jgi:hypothetical protein
MMAGVFMGFFSQELRSFAKYLPGAKLLISDEKANDTQNKDK